MGYENFVPAEVVSVSGDRITVRSAFDTHVFDRFAGQAPHAVGDKVQIALRASALQLGVGRIGTLRDFLYYEDTTSHYVDVPGIEGGLQATQPGMPSCEMGASVGISWGQSGVALIPDGMPRPGLWLGWREMRISARALLFLPILAFMAVMFIYPLGKGFVSTLHPERKVEVLIPDTHKITARRGATLTEGAIVAEPRADGAPILAPVEGRATRMRRSGETYVVLEYRSFGWDNYIWFFSEARNLQILKFTAIDLGLVVTFLSVVLGLALTYRLRKPGPGVNTLRAIVAMPMAYAGLIAVTLIYIFFSSSGLLSKTLVGVGLIDEPIRMMGKYVGLVIASVYQQAPFIFLFLLSAMVAIPETVEEAARTLGANSWKIFVMVIIPLILPAILTVAILGYIQNYGAFVTALIAGDPVQTKPVLVNAYDIYIHEAHLPRAATVAYIAGAFEMIFISLYLYLLARQEKL